MQVKKHCMRLSGCGKVIGDDLYMYLEAANGPFLKYAWGEP